MSWPAPVAAPRTEAAPVFTDGQALVVLEPQSRGEAGGPFAYRFACPRCRRWRHVVAERVTVSRSRRSLTPLATIEGALLCPAGCGWAVTVTAGVAHPYPEGL